MIWPFLLWEPQKSKMAARGPQNGRRGLERGLPLGFGTLSLNKFLDPSTPSRRKVDYREKKRKKKIRTFIVATNVVASRPPKRRPTETPHARAKRKEKIMPFLVATNVVASQPSQRRLTGTPQARANIMFHVWGVSRLLGYNYSSKSRKVTSELHDSNA